MSALKMHPGGVKDANDSTGDVVAIMNSGAWDRTGERIDPAGWDLDTFMKSGVITLNHAGEWDSAYHALPIATRQEAWIDDAGLMVHYRYLLDAPGQLGELANTIYYLEKSGALVGHSVWFEPFAWTEADGNTGARGWGDPYPRMPMKGRTYTKTGLLECGPVLIPAEPGSVTMAVKAFEDHGLTVPEWAKNPFAQDAESWRRSLQRDSGDMPDPADMDEIMQAMQKALDAAKVCRKSAQDCHKAMQDCMDAHGRMSKSLRQSNQPDDAGAIAGGDSGLALPVQLRQFQLSMRAKHAWLDGRA